MSAEVFDRLTLSDGGIFRWEEAPEPARTVYKIVLERASDLVASVRSALPLLPEIEIHFVRSPRINAAAYLYNGSFYIGLTTGIVVMTRFFFGQMLAEPTLFPNIGNSNLEHAEGDRLRGYIPDAEELVLQRIIPVAPLCPTRRDYADFLWDQSMMFLVGHEIAHIAHGHLGYYVNKTGVNSMVELGAIGHQVGELDRQSIEMDADRRSAFSRFDSGKISLESDMRRPNWYRTEGDKEQWLFDSAVSTNVLFRLLGDSHFNHARLSEIPYPPLPLRRIMLEMVTAYVAIETWPELTRDQIADALVSARDATENAFALLTNQDPDFEGLREALGPVGMSHYDSLQTHWNEQVLPRVRPHAYAF